MLHTYNWLTAFGQTADANVADPRGLCPSKADASAFPARPDGGAVVRRYAFWAFVLKSEMFGADCVMLSHGLPLHPPV